MSINWNIVTSDHVKQACEQYDNGIALPKREARSTFLIFNGKSYPGKFIRGLAYRLATGIELDPNRDYAGGEETVRFFKSLGLITSHATTNLVAQQVKPTSIPKITPPTQPASPRKYEPQKQALYDLLTKLYGSVECESVFPWLVVPNVNEMSEPLASIYGKLQSMRGYSDFVTAGYSLKCDFVVPHARLIVEYDERQHFTLQRAAALELYPLELAQGFDHQDWINACNSFRANDPNPPHRDEQRAFYDSCRDILAARHGYRLLRFRQGGIDWTNAEAAATLASAIRRNGSETRRVALVSRDYNLPDSRGEYDFSEYLSQINAVCDKQGCDTILFSLYTLSKSRQLNVSEMLSNLKNVKHVVVEYYEEPDYFDRVEVWQKGQPTPIIARQRFAQSTASWIGKKAFIDDWNDRQFGNNLLVICGESNIVSLRRASGEFVDPFGFANLLDKRNVRVVFNPIHDYMRRYEMREKRRHLSQGGRTVISVWNRGKGKEAWLPWTVFHNGIEMTDLVREIPTQIPERPDIRIGIFDIPCGI